MIMNIREDLRKLNELKSAVIDSSSVIYLQKLGLLKMVSDTVQLYAPLAVLNETKLDNAQIQEVDYNLNEYSSADDQVLAIAVGMHYPLISDDKKILQQARGAGADYFNTLMIVLLLFLRGYLSKHDTERKMQLLEQIAWYGDWIWEYGRQVFEAVELMSNKNRE